MPTPDCRSFCVFDGDDGVALPHWLLDCELEIFDRRLGAVKYHIAVHQRNSIYTTAHIVVYP